MKKIKNFVAKINVQDLGIPGTKKNVLIFVFGFLFFSGQIAFSQDVKAELKFIDVSDGLVNAGLNISQVQKAQFDNIVEKVNELNHYTVEKEYYEGKNYGQISLKSKTQSNVQDFQSLLKHLGIHMLIYNGQNVSSQEIENNYKPVNKTEVKKIERR